MTMIERIACAIAASRTGSTTGWEQYRGDALRVMDAGRRFPTLRRAGLRAIDPRRARS